MLRLAVQLLVLLLLQQRCFVLLVGLLQLDLRLAGSLDRSQLVLVP